MGSSHRITSARTTARWRSSRAGACRPRARAGTRSPAAPDRGCRPRRIRSSARSRAAVRERPRCTSGASAIWSPTRMTGLSAVIGSWKIIAIDRAADLSAAGRAMPSRGPRPRTAPGRRRSRRAGGSRPMIARSVMLLPQPDSPTSPNASPGPTVNDTPSTAWTVPRVSGISTRRSRTSRRGAAFIPAAAGPRAPSPISESPSPVMTTATPGMVDELPLRGDERLPVGDHRAPVGRRRLDAEAQVAERHDRSRMSRTMSDIANTIACVMTFGRRWRTMMRGSRGPPPGRRACTPGVWRRASRPG